jgi:hypothetical protein
MFLFIDSTGDVVIASYVIDTDLRIQNARYLSLPDILDWNVSMASFVF